jgi:phosphoribosylformylglycinamidine synthase
MRFGVVTFPGSNCDRDCLYVLGRVLGQDATTLWYEERSVDGLDCVILPGGFAYGDYLRAGAIASTAPIMAAVRRFARTGGLVLGICNGFQVLLEAGLLPGAMVRNRTGRFLSQDVYIRVESNQTPFTATLRVGQILQMPIAHGEGNFFAPPQLLEVLDGSGQIVFRYCERDGQISTSSNPNGACANIAGVRNAGGNVLGLMPHPERSSERILGSADGRRLFESVIISFTSSQRSLPATIGKAQPVGS